MCPWSSTRSPSSAARVVVLVDAGGRAVVAKGPKDLTTAQFLDAAAPNSVLLECMERVRGEWEAKAPHTEVHRGHEHAGFWLFYWLWDGTSMQSLLAAGHHDDLRAAAAAYVAYALESAREASMIKVDVAHPAPG